MQRPQSLGAGGVETAAEGLWTIDQSNLGGKEPETEAPEVVFRVK